MARGDTHYLKRQVICELMAELNVVSSFFFCIDFLVQTYF